MIFQIPIKKEEMIGRFQTGFFVYNNGYIFYGNNVIKIRYDLINSINKVYYGENDLFNFYLDVFDLDKNIKVRCDCPIDSIRAHKFAYLLTDKNRLKPIELMIMPYLHERRIYLNPIKDNTDYFYTSIETNISEFIRYN